MHMLVACVGRSRELIHKNLDLEFLFEFMETSSLEKHSIKKISINTTVNYMRTFFDMCLLVCSSDRV